MRTLQLIHGRTVKGIHAERYQEDFTGAEARDGGARAVDEFPMLTAAGVKRHEAGWSCEAGGFFAGLSAEARSDFELHLTHFRCPGATTLIGEEQKPSSILFVLEGAVNISMNSPDGKRLLLEVAGAGDTLGLTSVISGDSSEIRAETMYPCRIASLHRQDFIEILLRHPTASQSAARELCLQYTRACERLRLLGLTSSATARLAHLLLEWCRGGQQTTSGTQVRCALTHREIGECIGASRETVSRVLADFRSHDLVRLRGATLVVTSPRALALYAGINSMPDPRKPAA
jgi:CRP/FNR family transcriptional regulator